MFTSSVGRVVAQLRSSVRALMVFARSMQFSDNMFLVNLRKEKWCVSSEAAMQECERGKVAIRATEGRWASIGLRW